MVALVPGLRVRSLDEAVAARRDVVVLVRERAEALEDLVRAEAAELRARVPLPLLRERRRAVGLGEGCLLYTSDAADE